MKYNGCKVIEEFEPSLPRDAVWDVWLKLVHWFPRSRHQCYLMLFPHYLKEVVVFHLNKLHSFPFKQKCSELG